MSDVDLARYATDPAEFIDDLVTVNERGEPFRLMEHQRELLRCAFTFDADGRLRWDTFIYSCPKKSGKTTINGALTTWWSFVMEAPNEVLILANDQEQAGARVYASVAKLITRNAKLAGSAKVESKRIALSNGTTIITLASEYAGAAGSNHGLVSFDELWAFTSERSRRLVDELTSVPTRRNSIRLITTYAGWPAESALLWSLYRDGVGPDEHPEGQGERIHPTLPLYLNREARLLTYWDREGRMPWQTPAYYAAQRRSLRPATFARLHENTWSDAEGSFLDAETWDGCTERTWEPADRDGELQVWAGVDASVKHDACAVIAVAVDPETQQVILVRHYIWTPTAAEPLDLEATVERAITALHDDFNLRAVYADPYQMHRSITTLQRRGVRIAEFPQTTPNLVRMAQGLDDLVRTRQLVVYPDPILREHALNAAASESANGVRIVKRTAGRRIDSLIALAMAAVATVDVPYATAPSIGVLA